MTYVVKHPRAKVHATTGQRPMCGGGKGGRSVQWQQDIGPETCRACKKVALRKISKLLPPPPARRSRTRRCTVRFAHVNHQPSTHKAIN